jgi:hypothetical protein
MFSTQAPRVQPATGERSTSTLFGMTRDWRAINLANWESRVPVHLGPSGYHLDAFDDPSHLSRVVRYDLPRLGRLGDGRKP